MVVTAREARKMAREFVTNDGSLDRLREKITLDIMSEADTGHRRALFLKDEFESTLGIEFVIDELLDNRFEVDAHFSMTHRFESMLVTW